jgi:CBS domain-containing protein
MPVSAVLATDAPTVAPDLSVTEFVRRLVIGHHAVVAPVVEDTRLVGMIDVADVEAVPRSDRDATPVRDAMRADHPVGHDHWTLKEAVTAMEAGDVDVLPIVDAEGRYVGLLSTGAILALSDLLDESDDYGPRPEPPAD